MTMTTDKIRNLGLIGQRGAGKTTLAEAMAYSAGVTNRLGVITDGTTLSDYTDEEKSRQTSLNLSLLRCPWKSGKINIVDMPGHMDFTGDVLAGIAVADTIGVVINAGGGVEVGTLQFFHYVEKDNKPAFFIVNRLDKENTDFDKNVASIQEAFGSKAVPVNLPIGKANDFKGIIDLIKMKAITFDDKGKQTPGDIPADLKDDADAAREKMIESIAETNDDLLEKFFEAGTLSDEDLLTGLKSGIAKGGFYPILAAAATSNIGASSLLDFTFDYAPSPAEVPVLKAVDDDTEKEIEIPCKSADPVAVYVFKIISEQHVGDLALAKVFAGTIKSGVDVVNVQKGNERIGQMFEIIGKDRKEIDGAEAGDIVALVKLKDTHSGNSLCLKSRKVVLPIPDYPEPVMDMAIRPKAKGDDEKMGLALNKLGESDPTFKMVQDPALKQTLLFGQGPTQVDLLVEKLKNRFGVEVDLDRPRIPYRETIKGTTEIQGKYKKQSGGRGQYGDCWLRLSPLDRGVGFEFADEIKGGVIPGKFVPSVEKGVVEAMLEGGLCGAQVVDVKVTVYFGSFHAVDSSDMAFKVAASMGFKDGYIKSKPIILEPIFNITVFAPDEFTGDVMGDISSRRGKIIGMEPVGRMQRIRGSVPQSELYKYSVDLRSMSQGQAVYTRDFSHYEEVPHDVSSKLKEEYQTSKQEG
ncbi:MAG: elongation factor G [FCB group bacterium]|nr:elongation factor G [FCB group bacterium]